MKGKIGLEEHFAIDDTMIDSAASSPTTSGRRCAERCSTCTASGSG